MMTIDIGISRDLMNIHLTNMDIGILLGFGMDCRYNFMRLFFGIVKYFFSCKFGPRSSNLPAIIESKALDKSIPHALGWLYR